jgi:hypothetical protein
MLASGVALTNVVSAASLRLTWTDRSTNESGFKIERQAADGSFAQLATVGANVTSYTDSNLTSGRAYCYIVRAFNSAGSSNPTNVACGTTASGTNSGGTPTSGNSGTTTSLAPVRSIYPGVTSAIVLFSTNTLFVNQQYLDFLDRKAESKGLSTWVNALNKGFPKANMIESLMDSAEFRQKGKFIAQTYLGILARDPGHDEFRDWLGALLEGMTREEIAHAFLESGEFKSRFGSNLSNAKFVERMYANVLLRKPETAGFNFWVGQLNSRRMVRSQVALAFLDSVEFQNLNTSQNRMDVSLLYFNLLRRDPDANGFAAWVEALNSGLPLSSAIDAFLMSGEYQSQF